ncbi:NAD-dependent epimerase/dehydratase family protein [Piscinibacter sp.]|uniref:NAD-dependent epimerase/dehydratase family protein n=1 Tax=Piscinibacter sp. TaxID=1903157 RepID=UPI002C9970F1|nr:NAD-dependent epimerase/dehydratase family protein [Albitalea sp.]HUG26467.1 NAD-dependent epimerase/dehydratase family protein [Albitalea sp.]
MKVFLTGGTGFIGQALVSRIRGRGWPLKVLVRDPQSQAAQWIARQGATLVQGDVTEPTGLAAALEGSDVVIHNAGVYEFGADRATMARMTRVNVDGTENMMAAAHAAGVSKVVYVSTAWALGPSGRPPAASVSKDERWLDEAPYLSAYHRSKADAHRVALRWRAKGLPIVTAMPNGVMGANDHSIFGYFLRLTLLGKMAPMAWGGESVYTLVDVKALAEGLCLAAEKAPAGEDYLFCGPRNSMRELFNVWGRKTGQRVPRWYLPRWFMRPQMALMEPLQRMAGLPAFMSRDTVDATRAHLDYSSAKAQRELGWTHPDIDAMWDPIIHRERELMAGRQGFLNKLRHQPVVDLPDRARTTPPKFP